jgi:hypothetical protein
MLTTRYAEINFLLYDIRKLRVKISKYHFYAIIKYYYRYEPDKEEVIINYYYTINRPTYSNLKKFLRDVKLIVLHRLNGM